jgi:hypothetical protein
VHGAVPLLFLLAIRKLDARKVWILWPLTFVPDLDYFVGLHRAALTNVFVLVPFAVVLAIAWRCGGRGLAEWMIVALVYLGSHLVMDALAGGVVPLYPLSDYTVCYYANIVVNTTTNAYSPAVGACGHAGIPQVAANYVWLSDTDAAMLAFLVPAGLAVAGWQLYRLLQDREAKPPSSENPNS